MEKRMAKSSMFSPKSHVLYESYKSGCVWSWIQIFNLRPNSNQKMISDKKHATDDETKGKRPSDGKLTLKDYIKEEKSIEHHRKKRTTAAQVQSEPEFLGDLPKRHQNARGVLLGSQSVLADEGKRHFSSPKRWNRVRKKNVNVNMNEAVEFINRKLIDVKKNKSRDFIDALQVLNSNKELFVKLLQDPNSLLVKHIEELRQSQEGKQKTHSLSEARNQSQTQVTDKSIVLQPNNRFEKGTNADRKGQKIAENDLLPAMPPGRNWLHSYNGAKMRFLPHSSYPMLPVDSLRTLTETTKFLDSLQKKEDDIFDDKQSNMSVTSPVAKVLELELPLENEGQGIKLGAFNEQEVVEDNTSPPSTGTTLDSETNFQGKHGSLSEYISAILQVSCPDWDKLAMKCQISEQILDPYLSGAIPAWLCFGDPRLIVSYINELLLALHEFHSRSYPWTPLLKPKHRNMIHEVLKHVDWQLLSQLPKETLEQVVEKDLRKSGNWIDTRNDAEDIVVEMVDGFLDELMVETVLNLGI